MEKHVDFRLVKPSIRIIDDSLVKEHKAEASSNKAFFQNYVYNNLVDEKMILEGILYELKKLYERESGETLRPLYVWFLEFNNESGRANILDISIKSVRSIANMGLYAEGVFSRANLIIEEFDRWAEHNHKDLWTFNLTKKDLYVDGTSIGGLMIHAQRKR